MLRMLTGNGTTYINYSSKFIVLLPILFILYGCATCNIYESADCNLSDSRNNLLKTMAYEKLVYLSREYFLEDYDLHDSHFLRHDEIIHFLERTNVSIDSLPDSLQKSLKNRQVVGILVTRFTPIPDVDVDVQATTTKALNPMQRMALMWEIEFNRDAGVMGIDYRTGALWFAEKVEECLPEEKCASYFCDSSPACGDPFVACAGIYKCPPCDICECCPGPPVSK